MGGEGGIGKLHVPTSMVLFLIGSSNDTTVMNN